MAQLAQAADELVDVIARFGDPAQGVFPEGRVIEMHRQVLQHQIEGGGRVL